MEYWSWALIVVTAAGLWLGGGGARDAARWYGWVVCIFAQVLWAIYGVTTGQWGFVAGAALFGVIYGALLVRERQWHKARRVWQSRR